MARAATRVAQHLVGIAHLLEFARRAIRRVFLHLPQVGGANLLISSLQRDSKQLIRIVVCHRGFSKWEVVPEERISRLAAVPFPPGTADSDDLGPGLGPHLGSELLPHFYELGRH